MILTREVSANVHDPLMIVAHSPDDRLGAGQELVTARAAWRFSPEDRTAASVFCRHRYLLLTVVPLDTKPLAVSIGCANIFCCGAFVRHGLDILDGQ